MCLSFKASNSALKSFALLAISLKGAYEAVNRDAAEMALEKPSDK